MELVLNTTGIKVTKRNNCFFLQTKKHKRIISPKRISSIAVISDCYFSSAAIILAAENEIPIIFYNRSGRVKSRLWSPYFGNISTIRRNQVHFAETTDATKWIIDLFQHKFEGQNSNIQWLKNRKPAISELVEEKWDNKAVNSILQMKNYNDLIPVDARNHLMGIEGSISKVYWEIIVRVFGKDYSFDSRTRRPATDIFNALLNYWYGMLYACVEGALLSVGLDPYLGILHADEYQNPTLAFDMIEPYRSWVDRLLFEICLQNDLINNCFDEKEKGYWLNKTGKKLFIPCFNDMIEQKSKLNGLIKKRRNHILYLSNNFVKTINERCTIEQI